MSNPTVFLLIVAAVALLYFGQGLLAWLVPGAAFLVIWGLQNEPGVFFYIAAGVYAAMVIVLALPPVRRLLISSRVMKILGKVLPSISETEKIALDAGTVWWDAEFFSGSPRWHRLLDFKTKTLSAEEERFLNGPVEDLCRMLDEWEIRKEGDLPPRVWEFIKQRGFFGMIIPKEYGGLGFSALAHSAVITKLSSRSVAAAVTVMVPNSLGPAELLLHYGTDEQKQRYLPRLARAEEIPCFALTEPNAGSDAASIQSEGVVCRDFYQGKEIIGIRLNWKKRYITLGPIATVLGLAFKLRDPHHLLGAGGKEEVGITCALIPPNLPGIEIGQRHDPLGVPFMNGPNSGRDVFVPLDCIIGGPARAGEGWKMLMQCLAAGRSISLPSLSTGAGQYTSRVVSAYAYVREQFNVRIGQFEGIEERLARIAGFTYVMNAARVQTASAVDSGEKPAVVSAIVKAYMTEMMRTVVNDGMDVQGGAAICEGPRNTLAGSYISLPIGITVEGANILTRTLIIYGQGAMRCHPYVRAQVEAMGAANLNDFDRAFFGHVGFSASNAVRAVLLGITNGRLSMPPAVAGAVAGGYFRSLTRFSAAFAILSDVALGTLGGSLKRKEKLSGRFADALAWMYLASCALKSFIERGKPADEVPLLRWSCEHALHEIEEALLGILANFPNRPLAWTLKIAFFPLGRRHRTPSDRIGGQVARALLTNSAVRDELTRDIFVPPYGSPGLGMLESAFRKAREAQRIMDRVREGSKYGTLSKKRGAALIAEAVEKNFISAEEHRALIEANRACDEAIQVDSFDRQTVREMS